MLSTAATVGQEEKEGGVQLSQANCPVLVAVLPGSQVSQTTLPCVSAKVPEGQAWHWMEPVLGL
jgi:hypothetical protein